MTKSQSKLQQMCDFQFVKNCNITQWMLFSKKVDLQSSALAKMTQKSYCIFNNCIPLCSCFTWPVPLIMRGTLTENHKFSFQTYIWHQEEGEIIKIYRLEFIPKMCYGLLRINIKCHTKWQHTLCTWCANSTRSMTSDGRFVCIVLTRVTPIGWLLASTNDTDTQNQTIKSPSSITIALHGLANSYPCESFREGLCFHRRTFICCHDN